MPSGLDLVILDVDGVMTNGCKVYGADGKTAYKSFNDRDFTAIKELKSVGVRVCFLSGDRTINDAIAKNRRIDFHCSRENGIMRPKVEFLPELLKLYSARITNTAYVGDDLFDVPLLKAVEYPFCPSDAHPEVREVSIVLNSCGGEGVVSEMVYDLVGRRIIPQPVLIRVEELDRNETF